MKWCPNANCQRAVHLESFDKTWFRESVRCECGNFFCFKCQNLSHDPVDCSLVVEWSKVRSEDFEAQNWILHNTKACPKCQVNIQKNGGCMHITCKCRHEFCWVCMAVWSVYHNCRANESVTPTAGALKNLRRFATYNAKHEIMKQAYELDVAQYKTKLNQGLTEIELEKQWVKMDFIVQAIEVLLQCRRTLMHAYIFSYFMTSLDNQMSIFEANLQFLEQCTEQLSEVLENDVTVSNVGMMREKIIDLRILCEKRRRGLLDHITEGYDENWWRKFPIPVEELVAAESLFRDQVYHQLLY